MEQKIDLLQSWIDDSSNLVFYSGPGLSAESGVHDFRRLGTASLETYGYPTEAILSRPFFERKPAQFFRFYREQVLAPLLTAEPNAAHRKLFELEAADKLRMIVTQNIDGLHQDAGSRKVLELSGSVMRNDCPRCERRLSTLEIYEHPGIPYCDVDMCGGVMTPDVMLFGDGLHLEILSQAIYYVLTANILVVAGASLLDYPAAAVLHHYSGKKLVLINEEETPMESRADLVIHAPISEVMDRIIVREPN